jgi:hypothetical protein
MLECPACDAIYYQTDSVFSEDFEYVTGPNGDHEVELKHTIEHWPNDPPSVRARPDWLFRFYFIDEDLHQLLEDVFTAVDAKLDVLAAIGLRTAFDRATELLGVDADKPFDKKLVELHTIGKISQHEQTMLAVLTDAGGAAAHRGWRPKAHQLETMIAIVESFIHRNFLLDEDAKKLKVGIPPRKKRGDAA